MSTTSIEETLTTALSDAPAPDALAPAAADAPAPAARPVDPDVTTFRGRTLEELLPQIREQLGPEAIVVRQRDGLMGGIGGFFQQRFVEVDAKRGGPRIDVYDEQPAPTPESFAALLADAESDGEADAIVTAAAFAPPVGDSQPLALPEPPAAEGGPRITVAPTDRDSRSSAEPAPQPVAAPPAAELPPTSEPAPLAAQTAMAPTLTAELMQAGMSASFAERLVADAEAHELPFAPDLRAAVRRALARRIPTSIPHRAGGLAVAFAGPGSTACADALATAYKRAGRDARAIASLDRAQARLERGTPDEILALDLPPIATDRAEVVALAERLDRLTLDELVAVLPAELDLPSARALLDRLQPLGPTALALDADDAQLGAALELACTTRLPLAYARAAGAIAPADATTLAERLLP
jgi:flagellar biosynthesis protein FlhF